MKSPKQVAADRLKSELAASMTSLLSGETYPQLLAALKLRFPQLSFAAILNWIPDQGEDFYWIMVDGKRIVVAEVPRASTTPGGAKVLEEMTLTDYQRRKHSRVSRRTLKAALELIDAV
jgi:hypothetical protein